MLQVEAKRALSREEQQNSSRTGNPNPGRNGGGGGNIKTKKIFVGGLPPTLTEEGFREYFENNGHVTDLVVMYDQSTGRHRGFGLISFDIEDAVDRVFHKTFHDLHGKQVEVKRALPKDVNLGGGSRVMGGGAASAGYLGYVVSRNSVWYGAIGGCPRSGELQGSGGGYMGSSYSEANGNEGYGNAPWTSNPS